MSIKIYKIDLIKNRLDNEYKFESQKALIFLSIDAVSVISFITVMIMQKLYLTVILLSLAIISYSITFYTKTKNKMDDILNKINNIKILLINLNIRN